MEYKMPDIPAWIKKDLGVRNWKERRRFKRGDLVKTKTDPPKIATVIDYYPGIDHPRAMIKFDVEGRHRACVNDVELDPFVEVDDGSGG
jgi:hypothetical protein